EDFSFVSSSIPAQVLLRPRLYSVYLTGLSVIRYLPAVINLSIKFFSPNGLWETAMAVIAISSLPYASTVQITWIQSL
ncbi:hypothetical protein LINGRAHAP2_LOCUS2520, partial [Linum grandiflorum]